MPIGNVILVPGMLTSSLITQPPLARKQIWTNLTVQSVRGVDDLNLAADGLLPGPLATYGGLKADNLIPEAPYGPLLSKLREDGWSPDFFPFDWRKSVRVSGAAFASYLQTNYAAKDFYLVCHSLGGLVARWAYDLVRATPVAGHWKRTVYLNTPHGGSYDAPMCLAGWNPELSLLAFCVLFAGTIIRRAADPFAPIRTQIARLAQTVASWPAVYELFPVISSVQGWEDEQIPLLNDVTTWRDQTPFVDSAHLDAGTAFRAELLALLDLGRPPEVNVIGTGTNTRRIYADVSRLAGPSGYESNTDGDGVVTKQRQSLAGVNTLTLTSNHQASPYDDALLSRVTSLLQNGLPSPATVADPIALTPSLKGGTVFVPPPGVTWEFPVVRQDP